MKEKTKGKSKIEGIDIAIFLIVFIIFGIALLSYFPALMTSDGVDQMQQARNNSYYDAHPILHSFISGNLAKLGGVWVPALFQILCFALIWTWGCKEIRKNNKRNIIKCIEVVFTIIICILPLNFLYSITLWKDILYTYSMLASIICVYVGIKNNYEFSIGQMIVVAISNVGVMKLRHNGVPIGFIMFAILLVLNFMKNKNFRKSIIFIGIFVVTLVVATIPKWLFEAETATAVSMPFIPSEVYCFGALLDSGIELEEEEIEVLNKIFPVEEWKECYDHYAGTAILYNDNYHYEVLEEEEMREKFEAIFSKYAKQNMDVVIKHMALVNSIWWSPKELGPMHSVILSNDWISEMSGGMYDNHPILVGMNEKLTEYTYKSFMGIKYTFIYRPAVPMIIATIAILVIAWKERKFGYVYMVFPMFMNIGTYILFLSSQDHRYFYPNFLTCYFIILVLAATFLKERKPKQKEKAKIKDPKTLIIIPDYNEGVMIKEVVEDIQENAKGCDYIIVNDGSKDDTKQICKENGLQCLSLPTNYGLASAVQLGMKYALENGYDIAIQFDGDGQHQAKYIKDMIKEIENGADIVIGSRFVTKKKPISIRMLGSVIITFFIKMLADKKIKDPTSGMRAYNRECMKELVVNMNLPPEPDTLVYMIEKGMDVKEVQVEMKERKMGTSYFTVWKSMTYMINVTVSMVFINFMRK